MTVAEERLWDLRSLINFSRAVSKLMGVGKLFILQVSLCKGILQDIGIVCKDVFGIPHPFVSPLLNKGEGLEVR